MNQEILKCGKCILRNRSILTTQDAEDPLTHEFKTRVGNARHPVSKKESKQKKSVYPYLHIFSENWVRERMILH
jgi:hypothetical protein